MGNIMKSRNQTLIRHSYVYLGIEINKNSTKIVLFTPKIKKNWRLRKNYSK